MSKSSAARTLLNANVITMDPARPRATSIVLCAGRIAAIDESAGDRIDLGGATVLPGFIDSHLHCVSGGESLMQLDLSDVRSRREFEAAITERDRQMPSGAVLVAGAWNEDAFDDRALPDRTWLGRSARPIVCWRMDHHACVVNDAMLARLSAAHDLRRDPAGGRIVRDAGGAPTGLFQEAAAWKLVRPLIPDPSVDESRAALRAAQAHLASLGITTVGSMEYERVVRDAIEPLRDELVVRMRVTLLDREWPLDLSFAKSFKSDDRLSIIGMKAFIDGTLGSRTAAMLADYADDPGNRGLFVELAASSRVGGVLVDWARLVRDAGLSPSMHAIGDHGVRAALDAIDAIGASNARIEHAQTVAPEDVPRFRNRFASMQPLHKAYDARSAASRLGAARMDRFFPFRVLKEHGARLAFGSDWPIVSADPMLGIAAAVTGRDVDGRVVRAEDNVDVETALVAYTRGAAECLAFDDAGVIRVGGHADLVLLDRDPSTCDWVNARPRVVATVMGGRTTFRAPGVPVRVPELSS